MVRIVASAVAAATVTGSALFTGAPVAEAAPDVVNRTYQDAKRIIQRSGGKAVVATRTGNALAESRCLVTNAWDAAVRRPNRRGLPVKNREVHVALNCNGELAAAGTAGNSAASPAGRAAKKEQEAKAAKAARDRAARQAAAARQQQGQ
ncbi:hypothetical protein [Mycolicibacterium pulveris]|uniref:hypothetical protein n=1 Tax=Mycolicibacterium pulveris TaxID=36813 RepID=UPI003CF48DD7